MAQLLKGRYRILKQVGGGGFGKVYKAEDTQLGDRPVAIKEMDQDNPSQQDIATFKQEAFMLAGLHHPNLPSIHEYFEQSNHWYLVMDFIEGETLEDYLDKATGRKLSVEEVLNIGIQLCTVLIYLHEHQPSIIFRDLKPSNIMRTSDGHLYLIDFGIARYFKPGKAKDTVAIGTPGYAAPEQYDKEQTTPQSDIYGLGAMLHQLLSGIDPTDNPLYFAPLRLPHQLSTLERLIMQMVSKVKDQRPTNVADIKQRLQDIAELFTIPSHLPQPMLPAVSAQQLSSPVVQLAPPIRKPVTFSQRAVITPLTTALFLGLIFIVVIGSVGFLYSRQNIVTINATATANAQITSARARANAIATARVNALATASTLAVANVRAYASGIAGGVMFGFNSQHTHFNPYERALNPISVHYLVRGWTASSGGWGFSDPTEANGAVYIASYGYQGNFYALDATTGKTLWSVSITSPLEDGVIDPSYSSPAVANGVVYVASKSDDIVGVNIFYAFDVKTGKMLWSASNSGIADSSPTIAKGVVYITSYEGQDNLYAFDATTGKMLWSAALEETSITPLFCSSPAVANGVVYVGSDDHKLYAFDATTGKMLWSATTGDRIESSPAVANGVVYVGSDDHKLYAFDATTGKMLWSATTGEWVESSPTVANGVVYVGSFDHKLYAFDALTGKTLWSATTGDRIESSPTVANGVVYVSSMNGNLYTFHLPF